MILPESAVQIIREYSKPLTHPNWKTRKWICVGDMYNEITSYKNKSEKYDKHYTLYRTFTMNVQNEYSWWNIQLYYLKCGLKFTSIEHDIPENILRKILSLK